MMNHAAILLHLPRPLTDHMNDFHLLSHGSGAIESGEFADTVGSDEASCSLPDTSIAVDGVGGIEFIGVADPFQTINVVDVVEQCEVEVFRYAEDVIDAALMDAECVLLATPAQKARLPSYK